VGEYTVESGKSRPVVKEKVPSGKVELLPRGPQEGGGSNERNWFPPGGSRARVVIRDRRGKTAAIGVASCAPEQKGKFGVREIGGFYTQKEGKEGGNSKEREPWPTF